MLNILAQIGGLQKLVSTFCMAIVIMGQYHGPLQFLMANLYFDQKKERSSIA